MLTFLQRSFIFISVRFLDTLQSWGHIKLNSGLDCFYATQIVKILVITLPRISLLFKIFRRYIFPPSPEGRVQTSKVHFCSLLYDVCCLYALRLKVELISFQLIQAYSRSPKMVTIDSFSASKYMLFITSESGI